ncbi:hypothetical protein E2C01_027923 [Portunus trituberculatus]|uniref:Uncharacterized protein n=1 Tax=Portunus trituberculatus TaxID=210409 RepID=A0A5B7EJC8_PORTR|nr:hypothetical protein [Portunus trituberculatus]
MRNKQVEFCWVILSQRPIRATIGQPLHQLPRFKSQLGVPSEAIFSPLELRVSPRAAFTLLPTSHSVPHLSPPPSAALFRSPPRPLWSHFHSTSLSPRLPRWVILRSGEEVTGDLALPFLFSSSSYSSSVAPSFAITSHSLRLSLLTHSRLFPLKCLASLCLFCSVSEFLGEQFLKPTSTLNHLEFATTDVGGIVHHRPPGPHSLAVDVLLGGGGGGIGGLAVVGASGTEARCSVYTGVTQPPVEP